jgi:hypothetical protein
VRDCPREDEAEGSLCVLSVSAEVECLVGALSLVASVEICEVFALVGPMDAFDYRRVARLQVLLERQHPPTDRNLRLCFLLRPRESVVFIMCNAFISTYLSTYLRGTKSGGVRGA